MWSYCYIDLWSYFAVKRHFWICFLFLHRSCKLLNYKKVAGHMLPSNIMFFKIRMFPITVKTDESIFTQKNDSSVKLLWNTEFPWATGSSWSSLSRGGFTFFYSCSLFIFLLRCQVVFVLSWIFEIPVSVGDINLMSAIFVANIFVSFQRHLILYTVHSV